MALPPTLKAFKERLDAIGFAKRSTYQDKLLEELEKLDGVTLKEDLAKAAFSTETRMTSPGGGGCPCCGR